MKNIIKSRNDLRKVTVKPAYENKDKIVRLGYFHEWANIAENYDDNLIVVTKGLIEFQDGYIYPMDPGLIVFTN